MFAVDFAEDNIYKTFTVPDRCHKFSGGLVYSDIVFHLNFKHTFCYRVYFDSFWKLKPLYLCLSNILYEFTFGKQIAAKLNAIINFV